MHARKKVVSSDFSPSVHIEIWKFTCGNSCHEAFGAQYLC